MTGRVGRITDVAGIRVGHCERIGEGWLTGVTVVLPPPGTLGAVDVRGGAPGTHETDALRTDAVAPYPHAIVLTGGSAFGLEAAAGAVRWCAEHGLGHPVGPRPHQVVPVVPAAAVFDLGRGGDFTAHPTAQMGYDAAAAAAASSSGAPVARGTVGAGTGATLVNERFKGGVGTASTRLTLGDVSVVVGALAVVNAFGTPVRPGSTARLPNAAGGSPPALNTVLAVIATDALLSGGQLARTAAVGHDGLARAIDPTHTLADGDTVFALATGAVRLPGDRSGTGDARASRDAVIAVQAAAAHAVQAAVLDAVRAATAVRTPAVDLRPFPLDD